MSLTLDRINEMFPPSYGGNAQISDLRLALMELLENNIINDGIEFHEVATIPDRDQLQNIEQGDICKVAFNNSGNPETFIYDEDQWKTLVIVPTSGGGGTTYVKVTEEFAVGQIEEQYQEINLAKTPVIYEHIFVFLNGLLTSKDDFTVVGNSIQFVADFLIEGDSVIVKYGYQP
jgi:hypothetical protein